LAVLHWAQHEVAFWQAWFPGQSEVVPPEQLPLGLWQAWLVVSWLSLQTLGQVFGVPALQEPPWQVSPVVHWSPSSQGVPLEALPCTQALLEQVSVVQGLLSLQSPFPVQGSQPLTSVPLQVPPLQTSLSVQASLSLQVAVLLGFSHTPPVQTSLVQGLLSLQTVEALAEVHTLQPLTVAPAQTPEPLHWSLFVQALLSLQEVPLELGG
jgi:hypothetical protein